MTDLLDLLAAAEAEAGPPPTGYSHTPVGARARAAAWEAATAYRDALGKGTPWDGLVYSPDPAWLAATRRVGAMWSTSITHPERWTTTCHMTVLSADTRCDCDERDDGPCQCVGDLLYRGACLACAWEGDPVADDENAAAEDAADHAFPGWRDLPVLDPINSLADTKQTAAYAAKATAAYPPGWLQVPGAPVRTHRTPGASRHVPGRSPAGGYDMGVPDLPETQQRWDRP